MPPAMPILFVNLLFYFIILLADTDTLKNKALKLIPYTALGIVSGMVFMNAQHGVRYFILIPGEFVTGADGLSNETTDFGFFTLEEINGLEMLGRHRERIMDTLANQREAFVR
jgi:hypothetical protein